MPTQKMTPPQLIGLILCRAVVPLWVLTGALFKLMDKSPSLLPKSIWQTADNFGINLYWLLAVLIIIELCLVGIMFFMPRLARPAAAFMLSVFCIVLIVELMRGATNCGCLGAVSPSPWLMLSIDGILLLGVILFAPPKPDRPELLPSGPATVTVFWMLGALSITAAMILPETKANTNTAIVTDQGTDTDTDTDGDPDTPQDSAQAADSSASKISRTTTIPSLVTVSTDEWIGKKWVDVDFSKYAHGWPDDISVGKQYIIYYSRSCEHCQSLLNYFFYDPPVQTTIIAVPESKRGFDVDGELPMDCAGCIELELPVGTDWFLSPPLVIALEDGIVKCAAEGVDAETDQPECLLWH